LLASKRNAFHFPPLGPTLVISPWNFPLLIPFSDTVSALASGNTVVLRPSTATPLIALLLGEIFLEAGLPPGALNIVVSRTAQAEEMIVDPRIQTVMFTGSVGVGKRIMELAARNLTNIVLELGGKDPMIVLKDADVERAARGAVWTAFMNCGQSCASIERAYVAQEIAPAFIDRVAALTRELKVGDPLDPGTDIGPMTTLGQLESVLGHLQDARARGAAFLTGGSRIEGRSGYFLLPTVLTGVDHTMKVMTEETFGPVLPIMSVADEDEAVALANDSEYGLTASVWTRDRKAAARIAQRLEAGTVTVNDHMYSFTEPTAIWGGIKKTGAGRSHGPYGLLHLVNQKYISRDFRRTKAQLWWFPYGPVKTEAVSRSLTLLFGTGLGRKLKTLWTMRPAWGLLIRTVSPRSLFRIARKLFGR
jgi:succinate-semialdehyde dehydrogenase/glutarate-semialdehyde dehydrogenase